MGSLQNARIDQSYPGLIKTNDEAAIGATEKVLQDGSGNNSTLSLGTASASFTGTLDLSGATVTGLPSGGGLEPVQLSGTTQNLDLGTYNFFDGQTLTDDTTLTFSNVPAEARFQYSYTAGAAPFTIAGASYNDEFFNSISSNSAPGISGFSTDGTKMYLMKTDTVGDAIYQYTLSTAWDVSTATYDSINFNLESQDNATGAGVYFKSDGLQFWVVGSQNDNVYAYTMSTAWDLSTATYSGTSFSVGSQETNPKSIFFKSDGTKFYVLGTTQDRVFEYDMSTAYDISTATYSTRNVTVQSQENNPNGLVFSADGTKFFTGGDGNLEVFQYNLSTAWDVSTASYSNLSYSVGVLMTGGFRGIAFSTDGDKFYVASRSNQTVFALNPRATTITLPASVQNPSSLVFKPGDTVTWTFYTLDTGTTVYVEDQPQDAGSLPGLVSGTGTDSIAVSSAVLSSPSVASGNEAIAIGNNNISAGTQNISIGANNNTNGTNIINIGDDNNMSSASDNSVLIRPGGGTGIAFRGSSVAIGVNTYPGAGGVAIGYNAKGNTNQPSVVIGNNANANNNGICLGDATDALSTGAIAIGAGAQATATNACAIGASVTAATAQYVTMNNLQLLNYASLNYADDTAAAAGGVPLGGVYHTSGALKIRIV